MGIFTAISALIAAGTTIGVQAATNKRIDEAQDEARSIEDKKEKMQERESKRQERLKMAAIGEQGKNRRFQGMLGAAQLREQRKAENEQELRQKSEELVNMSNQDAGFRNVLRGMWG